MSRRDWPQNPSYTAAWTLNLANTANLMQPPGGQAQEGELPANCFDVRRCRGYSVQVTCGTVVGGSCQIELQWSNTGLSSDFVSLGASYQLAIPAGTPPATSGFIVQNPWYPWVRVAVIGAASSGTANLYLFARD